MEAEGGQFVVVVERQRGPERTETEKKEKLSSFIRER